MKDNAPSEYKIETIQDIVNAVNTDNINNFLIDFKAFLTTYLATVELNKMLEPKCKDKANTEIVELRNFVWIDDGKHEQNINITSK